MLAVKYVYAYSSKLLFSHKRKTDMHATPLCYRMLFLCVFGGIVIAQQNVHMNGCFIHVRGILLYL